jgi:hypothetical protein
MVRGPERKKKQKKRKKKQTIQNKMAGPGRCHCAWATYGDTLGISVSPQALVDGPQTISLTEFSFLLLFLLRRTVRGSECPLGRQAALSSAPLRWHPGLLPCASVAWSEMERGGC